MNKSSILTEEMLEIRDEKGQPTGVIKPRSLVHRDGDLHGCSHVWVVRLQQDPVSEAEGKPAWHMQVLMQRRSFQKDSFPGQWDISAAGHLERGETYETGAWRELAEELGVGPGNIQGGRLRYLFMFRLRYKDETFNNNELDAVYMAEIDQPESFFTIQKDEIEEIRWMDADAVLERIRTRSPEYCVPQWEFEELYPHLQAFERFANEGTAWTWREHIQKAYHWKMPGGGEASGKKKQS